MSKQKVLLSWSSGKDSAWALHLLQQDHRFELSGLLTTVNNHFDRVSMHGVRRDILRAQAHAAQLPLVEVEIPWPCTNEIYEETMLVELKKQRELGIQAIAFGDLFLEDVRKYREQLLEGTGLEPVFPVWGLDTTKLAQDMVASGLQTHVVCVSSKQLDPAFSGRLFDQSFLDQLPSDVDPCGENGEFHTCVSAGPMFSKTLYVERGETVDREGFIYTDLVIKTDQKE